jgi:hypothetical protein
MISPNTFLIGVQKGATTSVYNWLSQHPEICAPVALKDFEYFTRKEYFTDKNLLNSFYKEVYNYEEIIMQGSVHYIFFEQALKRIKEYCSDAKFILILRNPVDRAISAYHYAVKFNYENLSIEEAFAKEEERLKSDDIRILSELTYKEHGLYYKQIKKFYEYFDENQIEIQLYEDVSKRPEEVTKSIFKFLGVDTKFVPEYKSLNNTGEVKSKFLQKVGFGNNPIRNFFVRKVLRCFLSENQWAKFRFYIIHKNTKSKNKNYIEETNSEFIEKLKSFYREDIKKLETLINKDLSSWKQ